jgi:hypothetical protein
LGQAPNGFVGLRNFDEGIVETLGAKIDAERRNYFIPTARVAPVQPPPGLPGIPITFSHPEDVFERYRLPVIVVRRDDIAPALSRWHPGHQVWRAPAEGARPFEIKFGDPKFPQTLTGFESYEAKPMAVPFDITYSLSILARHRGFGPADRRGRRNPSGAGSPRTQVNQILDYVLRIYQPFSRVVVKDSLGDLRTYEAFMEAISHLDEVSEITDRVLGFALTLRVEAELDLNDPETSKAVLGPLTVREKP